MSIGLPIVYNKNLEKALQEIENNLAFDLSIEELAHISGYSPFHFQRLFKQYTKETAHHYICRLKLEKAAFMLKYEKNSISQAIDRVGFSCNSSFGRAFKNHFNICPKDFTESFKSKFKSNDFPEFEIVNLDERNVFFVRAYGNYKFSEPISCDLLEKSYEKIINKSTEYMSICYDEPTISMDKSKMRYDACILASKEDLEEFKNVPVKKLKGGKYAKFKFEGTLNELDLFFYKIYETFFHNKTYQISTKPAIQIHHNDFKNLIFGTTKTDLLIPLIT